MHSNAPKASCSQRARSTPNATWCERPAPREDGPREELAVVGLVEPRALKVEERDAGHVREGKRVDRELRERLVGARVRLVVEDVDRAVPDLQEIDVAGDDARLADGVRH
jgi:hypothetical protein